jgi:hypothetical protein
MNRDERKLAVLFRKMPKGNKVPGWKGLVRNAKRKLTA